MFKPLKDYNHFQQLIKEELNFLIYKYNPNYCPLSDKTKPKVENFLSHHESIEWYLIDVIEQPELKVQVAEYLKVAHESPQILCFKSGEYSAHTSHMKIKESRLDTVFGTTTE
jgi:bacillithiol system protein YtxJ